VAYDTRFGPTAQTPEQRAWVLQQMQALIPELKSYATGASQRLFACYVAGELSWADMRQALKAGTKRA
jgi:hypothetical protein